MTSDKQRLDDAIEHLKHQMAKPKQDDWKKAYLHKVNLHKQSLNKTFGAYHAWAWKKIERRLCTDG